MKNVTQNLAMLSAVIAFSACQNTAVTVTETPVASSQDSITETEKPSEARTVEGTVLEVTMGKDGYTAKLETEAKEIYFVTISHPNLKNHEQYKSVKAGEKLTVTGDYWEMGKDKQITVREIH